MVTFKKHPHETGLRHVGNPHRSVDIKRRKKIVGVIIAPNYQRKGWRPQVAVLKKDINEDGNPNCKWKWVVLGVFETEEQAREKVRDEILELMAHGLHEF